MADVSNGEQATLVSWGLNITAVPEPSSLALGMLGALALFRRRSNWR